MSETNYEVRRPEGGAAIKSWTKGVPVEDAAWKQLENTARLPFIFQHVAAMPDVHFGMGATVGSVVATQGAIVPAAVGVDIGCGMMAVQTSLTANDLPTSLSQLRTAIERAVPHGRSNNGGHHDQGAWHDVPATVDNSWADLSERFAQSFEHRGTCVVGVERTTRDPGIGEERTLAPHAHLRRVRHRVGDVRRQLGEQRQLSPRRRPNIVVAGCASALQIRFVWASSLRLKKLCTLITT